MTRVRISAATAIVIAAHWLAAPLPAQDLTSLKADFMAEARILEAEIDDYFDTREAEQEAIAELSRRSRQLDDTLGDAHGSVSDLVRLEGQVAAAREQGLALQVADVFEHQTIVAMAAAAQTTARLDSEQGPVVGDVPLNPIQYWFFELELRRESHFNQSHRFAVSPVFEPAVLKLAIDGLFQHHDALRSRFTRTELGWRQEILPRSPDEVFVR